MEVHAHTHTERKKWIHYFWEFLMLFFAVFCGFLAEYQLEHKIEKDREKKYIESMLDDLKKDTANFRFTIYRANQNMDVIDSLITMLQSSDRVKQTSLLYYLARKVPYTTPVGEILDRTYSQMKSSGNLRLLHSKAVADSITSYYFDIGYLASQQNYITSFLLDYLKNVTLVFDARVFHKMFQESGLSIGSVLGARTYALPGILPPAGNPPLADTSNQSVNILVGNLHFLFGRMLAVRNMLWSENQKGIRLIQLLEKEYNL